MKRIALLFPVLIALSACGIGDHDRAPLKGERISVMDLKKTLEPDNAETSGENAFTNPQAWQNEFWPQAGGYPNHSMQQLALNEGKLNFFRIASLLFYMSSLSSSEGGVYSKHSNLITGTVVFSMN